MFCCTRRFAYLNDEPSAAPPWPRRWQKKHSRRNKNRFSTSGLEKFSSVMTELQARKEQILTMAGSPASAVVLFMYNNSCDWVPIVVRLPKTPTKKSQTKKIQLSQPLPPPSPEKGKNDVVRRVEKARERKLQKSFSEGKLKTSFSWAVKERGRQNLYWGGVMVVILVCLTMFGRMFAICCTVIWWYRVPNMMGGDNKLKMKSIKKKDYVRRMSDKRLDGAGASSSLPRMLELGSPKSHVNVPNMMGGDNKLKMKSINKKDYVRRMSDKRLDGAGASSSLSRMLELGSPKSHVNVKRGLI